MAEGGRSEFEALVSDSLPKALRFAVRLTGRVDVAEEVVQEAMLSASRSWKTYRGAAQFDTWLLRIVVNEFRNWLAKRRPSEALPDGLVDSQQRLPGEMAAAAELSEVVTRQIAALPLRQREVIVLSVYENLTAEQIADVLGTNVNNVYSTLNVARGKLREQLQMYLSPR